jgi:hypothetical protein
MADDLDVEKDLNTLTAELKRLEAEYNMYFGGRLPRPPHETRSRVDALVKRLDRGYISSTGDKYRFETMQARYQSLVELWDRGLRSREEGRPGPFGRQAPKAPPPPRKEVPDSKLLHVTKFQDPMREMDKLHSLYDSLMDARRENGEDAVPFHRFASLVRDQVKKLRDSGSGEVAFRVANENGKVSFTVRGLKREKN